MDLNLFPNKEEWGTGDEAMDSKLSIALNKAINNLSFKTISEFYFDSQVLKLRTYNPGFMVTIELIVKGLFYYLDPNELVNHSLKKMKGDYYSKEKMLFALEDQELVLKELLTHKKYRYKNQIDFSLQLQDPFERNPFVRNELIRSSLELNSKIIFKDFKSFLSGETRSTIFNDRLFQLLQGGFNILVIDNFAEIWYNKDQIYSLPLMRPNL